jgi:Phosphoesterase family
MTRRVVSILGACGLLFGLGGVALASGSAQAASPRITAAGTASCSVAGTVRFKPGVTNAARAGVVWKLTAKLACSEGTTGAPAVTVVTGRLTATTAPSTRSCSDTALPAVSADIKWKATGGRVNPTHIAWPSGTTSTAGVRITTDLPGSGSGVVTGSYGGAVNGLHLVSDPVSLARCSTNGGFKRYPLADGAGMSSLSLDGNATTTPPTAACDNGQPAPAQYQSVVVFSFENRTWSGVGGAGFGSMPYLHSLAQSCSYFTSWTETDPSQNSLTQYGGQVTGAFQSGLVNDCSPSATCSTTADNIFRQARTAGRTAINYVEGATTACSASGNAAKHIPTLYLWGADDRAFCSAQTRPYSEFDPDNLPSFAFVTPTQCNDGHDCTNTTVDTWARANVAPVLDSPAYRAGRVAVFIWYDEDSPVPNLQIAPTARPGPFATSGIGYASTLKAWESMLGFPCLANACSAPNLRTVAGI